MKSAIDCPVCGKPATQKATIPFCTDRCRKIDFCRWWDGKYAITTAAPDDFFEDPNVCGQGFPVDDDRHMEEGEH